MTRFEAATPETRRALFAEAVAAHRRRDSDAAVFEAAGRRLRYDDRLVRFEVDGVERGRLDELLGTFPVFKPKQPETRKADDGVVFVSAIADAKHAADFLDAAFREVYGLAEDYEARVVRL